MQLHGGKIIGATTKKEKITQSLKTALATAEKVPFENMPARISAVSDTYIIILNNIDFITSAEFTDSEKFIRTVYNKSFELRSQITESVRQYIVENKIRDASNIYHQAGCFLELMGKLQMAINNRCPDIKRPQYCEDPDCPCDGYL
jgi:hypothetical protein